MGNNVYADFKGADVAKLKRAYEEASQVPSYVRLRETDPHLTVWDDHDYRKNGGGVESPYKSVAKGEFLKFWKVSATDIMCTRDGIYTSQIVDPPGIRLQIVLLDVRWFRSTLKPTDTHGAPDKQRYLPGPDPAKTMLGDIQWRRLGEELRKPADLRLIVSSTQVLAGEPSDQGPDH